MPRGRPTGRRAADLAGRFAARFAGVGAAFRAAVFFLVAVFFLAALFCAVFRLVAFGFGAAADFLDFTVLRFAAPREGFAADGGFFRRDGAAAGDAGAAGAGGCAGCGFVAGGFAARGFAGVRAERDGFAGAGAGAAGLAGVTPGAAVPPPLVPAPASAVSAIDDQSASLCDWSVGGSAMLANRQRSRNLMSFSS